MEINKMKYRDIIGIPKKKEKKKVISEQPKPSVTELLKKEFGGSLNEGPAYEYARSTKNIEKSWKNTHKTVMELVKELQKKGLKDEARTIQKLMERMWTEFDHYFEKTMDKLQ